MAGKGDKARPVDRKKWDEAEYWKELEKRKNKESRDEVRKVRQIRA